MFDTILASLGGLDLSKSFTKLDAIQITKETFKDAIWEVIATFASLVPPELLKIAYEKELTIIRFLEWWKQYTIKMIKKHKAEGNMKRLKKDIAALKAIKTIYAVIGAAKAFAMGFAPSKVSEFLTPENLMKKLIENLDKIKKSDPEGYRNLLLLLKYIKQKPHWWEKQVLEFRRVFLGGG